MGGSVEMLREISINLDSQKTLKNIAYCAVKSIAEALQCLHLRFFHLTVFPETRGNLQLSLAGSSS